MMALLLADTSECNQRHGSVVVKNGNPVGMGVNVDKNTPKYISTRHIKTHASVHAEAAAIARAGNCKGATIYVARRGKHGGPALSKPCPSCAILIEMAGIRRVVYTD